MKRDNPIRDAIDESLSGVRFNAHDERNVLRAIRSREEDAAPPVRRRRFHPGLAIVLTLAAVVAVPMSLAAVRGQRTRVVTAANGLTTVRPSVTPAVPEEDPILETSERAEILRAARACFEARCDTSVFSFDEYAVDIASQPQANGVTRYTVSLACVYDNGCRFTAVIDSPSYAVVSYSTPELATVPTFFDESSAEVQSWYERYGRHLFTWDISAQAEFSRRYEGASLRENRDGELTPDGARAAARQAVLGAGLFEPLFAYPTLLSERACGDGAARYVVYCFPHEAGEALTGPCAVVTLFAAGGDVESVEPLSSEELAHLP